MKHILTALLVLAIGIVKSQDADIRFFHEGEEISSIMSVSSNYEAGEQFLIEAEWAGDIGYMPRDQMYVVVTTTSHGEDARLLHAEPNGRFRVWIRTSEMVNGEASTTISLGNGEYYDPDKNRQWENGQAWAQVMSVTDRYSEPEPEEEPEPVSNESYSSSSSDDDITHDDISYASVRWEKVVHNSTISLTVFNMEFTDALGSLFWQEESFYDESCKKFVAKNTPDYFEYEWTKCEERPDDSESENYVELSFGIDCTSNQAHIDWVQESLAGLKEGLSRFKLDETKYYYKTQSNYAVVYDGVRYEITIDEQDVFFDGKGGTTKCADPSKDYFHVGVYVYW